MTRNKVSLKQVLSDDMTNPFWRSILNNPKYAQFEQETNHIIEQSRKHRKPYVEIGEDDLK